MSKKFVLVLALFTTSTASFAQQGGLQGTPQEPAFRQHDKTFGLIATPDDLDFELRQDFNQRTVEDRPTVGGIGKKFFEKREHAEQRR